MREFQLDPVGDDFVDAAPVRFVNSVVIDAPASAIWASFEDAASWPRWVGVIKRVEWTSQRPFGVGTTRTVHMTGGVTVYEEFLVWEPERCMGFRFDRSTINGVSAFAERYTLEAVAPERTRLTWIMAMRPKGMSRAVLPIASLPMRPAFGRWLRGFKKLVESEHRPQPASGH